MDCRHSLAAHATFRSRGAEEVLRVLRAEVIDGDGAPGVILDDQLTVACGRGAVRLLQVQRAGRNVITGAEFMRSGRFGLAKVRD